MEEVQEALMQAQESMEYAMEHLGVELDKIRAGKASGSLVSGLTVDYYGTPSALNQVASISTSDARTIVIQPWEKKMLAPIEKSIFEANLGITPQNDGEVIRLTIPPLTEERRKDMVKKAKAIGEEAKIGIRSARQKAMDSIKKAVKNGLAEDMGKRNEDEVQNMTNKFTEMVDKLFASKEADILTV